MEAIDRRKMLRNVLCGAAAAATGVTLMRSEVVAAPLAIDKNLAGRLDNLVEKTQVIVTGPRRHRRRRWVCWWNRGRRVCGWRWV